MVAQQRHALFNLVGATAAVCFFLALLPKFGILRAQAGFSLLGITAFGPLFFRKGKGQVISDERDRALFLRATQIGFMVFWLLFVAGVMGAWAWAGGGKLVSVDVLALGVWLAWALLLVCQGSILLLLYWRSS